MKRIMIVGGPGSGKSTLARWLGDRTGLPVQHMDHIHWQAGWVERTPAQKLPLIQAVEARDRWIIEGGMSTTYANRAARADMVIWLDLPIGVRLWRVARRSWQFRGQNRPDLAEGCPEQLNRQTLVFLRWCWASRHTMRGKNIAMVAGLPEGKALHHLTTRRAVRAFQRRIEGLHPPR